MYSKNVVFGPGIGLGTCVFGTFLKIKIYFLFLFQLKNYLILWKYKKNWVYYCYPSIVERRVENSIFGVRDSILFL